jgi:hypothetical protein
VIDVRAPRRSYGLIDKRNETLYAP